MMFLYSLLVYNLRERFLAKTDFRLRFFPARSLKIVDAYVIGDGGARRRQERSQKRPSSIARADPRIGGMLKARG